MAEKEDNLVEMTDQEREFAQTALAEFNKSNYAGCLQALSKLEAWSQDPKVVLNKAVAEFYKSEFKNVETFKKHLTNVANLAKLKPDVIEDVDQCVVFYNQAVLLFHEKKYTEALKIIDKIYKFIEPMEETLARKVCLLLIELYIITHQQNNALNLITSIENQFVKPKGDKDKNKSDKDVKKESNVDEELEFFKNKLSIYRAKCHLMNHSLKAAAEEIKTIIAVQGETTTVACLKSHLEYLYGNYQNAMEIFNSSPIDCLSFEKDCESSPVIFYNNVGVIHYAMGKPNLASYYLQQAIREDGKALSEFLKNDGDNNTLFTIGASKYHEIIYNLGIALLHSERPSQAFDCLLIAAQKFHRNCRLWLRIAECCIQVHKSSNEHDFDLINRQKEIIKQVVGSGKHRKLILNNNVTKDFKYSTESQSYAVPTVSLEFASLCLRNALSLLPSEEENIPPAPVVLLPGAHQPLVIQSVHSSAPSAPLSPAEIGSLRNSVLVNSSYVSLCLGDYVMALEHANNLLAEPKISNAHKLLGHLYSAESLVLMNKLSEAMEHLNPDLITDISVTYPVEETSEDEDKIADNNLPIDWFPSNLETAHVILKYNLAVALTMRGDLEKATELLKKIWQGRSSISRIPIHVVMLFLYIELKLGHSDVARSFVNANCSPPP